MMTTKILATLLLVTVLLILGVQAQIQVAPTNLTTGFVRFPNGTQQVTWFYTPTGLVAYDGDTIFGTTTEFDQAVINITYTTAKTDNSTRNSTVISRRSYPPVLKKVATRSDSRWPGSTNLWPGGKVYYRYFDDSTESQLSQYIDGAIASWTNAVPCISFTKLPNDNDPNGSNGIVTIVAHNPNVGYCLASQIGYGTNSLWMSLDTGGGCGVPEVTHEWGHLLGLIHEQKRPDAYINDPFICSNLIDYPFSASPAFADANYCGAPPSYGCAGWACQFTVSFGDYNIADLVAVDGGAFDLNSIMLYRNDAFAKPGTFTLTGGPNAHNNPQQLSAEDILRIRELYGCLPPPPASCPAACNPNPGANMCSWPSAQDCIYPSLSVANPRAACACRAGYKATDAALGIADGDTSQQWRLPADEGNFRVWVAEGVACDTLCDVWYGSAPCGEVALLGAECLHT